MPHEHSLVFVPFATMALLLLKPGDLVLAQLPLVMCGSLPVRLLTISALSWYRSSKINGSEVESPSAKKIIQ
jgi:hypothetical protein